MYIHTNSPLAQISILYKWLLSRNIETHNIEEPPITNERFPLSIQPLCSQSQSSWRWCSGILWRFLWPCQASRCCGGSLLTVRLHQRRWQRRPLPMRTPQLQGWAPRQTTLLGTLPPFWYLGVTSEFFPSFCFWNRKMISSPLRWSRSFIWVQRRPKW